MRELINDIKHIGFLHAVNHAFLRHAIRHYDGDKLLKAEKAFSENQEAINEFYTKFLKYF